MERGHLRAKILHDHLQAAAAQHSSFPPVLGSLLSSADTPLVNRCIEAENGDLSDLGTGRMLPGGLSDEDLGRFSASVPVIKADVIKSQLEGTLRTMYEFWSEDEPDDEGLQHALRLPEMIRARRQRIANVAADVTTRRSRVEKLTEETNTINPQLNAELITAIKTLSPVLDAQRVARSDELAMRLESCLLKLSLIRGRAHLSLYQYTSPKNPDLTMENAILALRDHFERQKREQEEEERQLDNQIMQYEELLQMVDGTGGGFSQIVEDMARISKETEECRRDLRRLGWTGD